MRLVTIIYVTDMERSIPFYEALGGKLGTRPEPTPIGLK